VCGLSGVPPSGSIPLVALRTPAGTGCARPSNPCRASICNFLHPTQKKRSLTTIRSLRLSKGRAETNLRHPQNKPVISGLAFVSFSGSTRESVKAGTRSLEPAAQPPAGSRSAVPEALEGPRKKNQKNPKKKKNTLDTFSHRVYIHTHRNERRGSKKDV